MELRKIHLRNFRRLEDVEIDFEKGETIFVGPNNSGKTSATTAFRLFLTRQDFKIHDFSVSKITDINSFGWNDEETEVTIPSIEMDMWFTVDPNTAYGRIASLLPDVATDFDEVGVRLKFSVNDAEKLKSEYLLEFPREAPQSKSLSQYLAMPGILNRHFKIRYSALEVAENNKILMIPLEPDEGKKVLSSLIRIDFVDAQRNIDDHEVGRSNRLSSAFAEYYRKNLKQAEIHDEANRVVDENNDNLNKHYEEHFKDLMGVIRGLGVPSVNDRQMRIVSTLSPEVALKGNTSLLYVDPSFKHELPEAYNGLGFKNLVYMAIQINHFHLQWMNTEEKRPLCQIIFIEEPEVHLHAQVQQTFIANIWDIIKKTSKEAGQETMVPQLAITTHSSHITDAVDFGKVRYFQRCSSNTEVDTPAATTTLNSSRVLNLRKFRPSGSSAGGDRENEDDTLNFLKRYLKLTHCDLFFADAAILVEGTVEKLLLPKMIEKTAPELKHSYITILEVGGAYANRFASLLEFIGIPYLVITDLDSVDPTDSRKVCRADKEGIVTSNASIKYFLDITQISDLVQLDENKQILAEDTCYIAFQKATLVSGYSEQNSMIGRTFEETFVYENMPSFREGQLSIGMDFSTDYNYEQDYETIFEAIKSSSFKKTEFALDVASSTADWKCPKYIEDGLHWLIRKINITLQGGTAQ